ncbi:unnamed protein product [Mycena citricolor]|uniref:Cell division control protein n=1 Tax=Mycena citricolor TaxID=2018698 RepID=A0AAD2HTU3_9AGAR|nr:unnamed protein product [Mycena citricolor]CAK5281976.1 unnamed protein product [Mycena citricolor]
MTRWQCTDRLGNPGTCSFTSAFLSPHTTPSPPFTLLYTMSARRQASSTSLSKFARGADPALMDRTTDYCNAFWGMGDGGVDVLFARMRGAARTMEELRSFWKERAVVEEEYAKRLGKLAKVPLGRDEIGDLRNSLDTIKTETEKQAGAHLNLAHQIRNSLEGLTATFVAKQQHHKKLYQGAVEKEFKAKQTQEGYVIKARDKYENDCLRINSYTAQLGLVQGKDAERIHLKLERAQQTVAQNERDFANFTRALGETVGKWESAWRTFCDSCQDLEDDRLEFTKNNMWAYANAVSSVCVLDDESCEHIRLTLEEMEPEKDQENFVRNYGTGNQIPDPPIFVNFTDPNAIPSASARHTFRIASFERSTQRVPTEDYASQPAPQPDPAEIVTTNIAGRGAGAGGVTPATTGTQSSPAPYAAAGSSSGISAGQVHQPQPHAATEHNDRASMMMAANHLTPSSQQSPTNYVNGSLSRATTTASKPSPHRVAPPREDPPAEETYMRIGENAYRVDAHKDPSQPGPSRASATPSGFDPLAKQMEDLQLAAATVRRKSTRRTTVDMSHPTSQPVQQQQALAPRPSSMGPGSILPPMHQISRSPSPGPGRDYQQSADSVVGSHPAASRPASPNPAPITAAFMRPSSTVPPGAEMITDVLSDYHQSLPGERKSVSRSNSRRSSYVGPGHMSNPSQSSQMSAGHNLGRPPSTGFAGVGSMSRSSSPQPMAMGPARTPSPGLAMAMVPVNRAPSPGPAYRQSLVAPGSSINRQGSTSPNPVGIAIDSTGRVTHDDMAMRYHHQQQIQARQPSPQPRQRQSMQSSGFAPISQHQQPQQQQPQQPQLTGPQRRLSYMGPAAITAPPPPPIQQAYNSYQQPPPQQHQQQLSGFAPSQQSFASNAYQQQQQQQPYQQLQQQQQPVYNGQGLQRGPSTNNYYADPRQQLVRANHQPPPQQQQQQIQAPPPQPQQQQLVRVPPIQQQRTPSPAGRQRTSDGKWIQFYVRALFDYRATIEEEFDFQEGDIIAVTETPEDGWWHGELLDDARRVPGKSVFPSNFTVMF